MRALLPGGRVPAWLRLAAAGVVLGALVSGSSTVVATASPATSHRSTAALGRSSPQAGAAGGTSSPGATAAPAASVGAGATGSRASLGPTSPSRPASTGPSSSPGRRPGPTSGPAPVGPTATSPFKPDLRGLVNDGQLPPADVLSQMAGLVAQETWADLQPTAADNSSGAIVHPNQIDRLLNYVQKYAPVAGLRLKIRVWTGMYSPSWAKSLDGASVSLNNYACAPNPQPAGCNGGSQTIQAPRWWSSSFQAAYDRFQVALGRAYDSNPLIAEVSSPRCMVVWDEPLVRPWDQWSMTQLLAAGYSEAQDVACQEEQLTSLQAAWPHTVVSFAVNPYINIDANGGAPEFHVDLNTTASLMSYCRQHLGDQCLLQNDELGRACSMPGSPGYSSMYTTLAQTGTPLAFMVDTPAATAGRSLASILGQAVSWHANSVEIGSPYTTSNPGSFFATYNSQLAQDPWG